jgi:hypothetical protein
MTFGIFIDILCSHRIHVYNTMDRNARVSKFDYLLMNCDLYLGDLRNINDI